MPLPNALPDAAGGLPVSDAGGLDLDARLAHLDAAVTSRAPATTALSTAQWTNLRAAMIDELSAANVPADIDTLLVRLSAVWAANLDVAVSSRATPAQVTVTVNDGD